MTWAILAVISLLLYAGACVYIKIKRQAAYDAVKIGDTAGSVIAQLGSPSVKETSDKLFSRYASSKCQSPCTERWWFENRLAFDIEAWSVSIGNDGTVVGKDHWLSP
jgi:hypothetical protein